MPFDEEEVPTCAPCETHLAQSCSATYEELFVSAASPFALYLFMVDAHSAVKKAAIDPCCYFTTGCHFGTACRFSHLLDITVNAINKEFCRIEAPLHLPASAFPALGSQRSAFVAGACAKEAFAMAAALHAL